MAQLASYSIGNGFVSLGVQRTGSDVNNFPPSTERLRMSGNIPPLPMYCSVLVTNNNK